MTPSEALTEAAKEGQVERAAQLFKQYNCGVSGALVAAATNGHLEIMKLLPFKAPCFEHHRQGQRGEDAWNLAAKLVISAAENDRLDVLKFVFPEGPDDDYCPGSSTKSCCKGAFKCDDALSNAIRGGHDDVTEYLLTLHPHRLFWNMKEACEAALAEFRSKNAVEFLYRNGHNDTLLVIKAFVEAARFGNTVVVEFLLDTKRIVSDIFDKAFEYAASSGYRNSPTAIFLYYKKLASKNSFIRVFEQAHDISVLKLLFEKKMFRSNLSLSRLTVPHTAGEVQILKFLLKCECISAQSIGKAFVNAAISSQTGALEFLCRDSRLPTQAVDKAYIEVVTRSNSKIMRLLYDTKRVSPEAILKAASSYEYFNVLPVAANYLFADERVSEEVKNQALLTAAHHGHSRVFSWLRSSGKCELPVEMLEEALGVASDRHTVDIITELIRDHI
ncbi:hypothetical protein PC128_g5798 [Phytophthora cactorum]|uniref:Ankyrin repeat-containing domain n=1 Tax=Phytophthora cactorum TaxID=29920 RepID=A0A8T1DPG2_9STRA|nr:hypothetical protein PC117_g10141 [Phytophthora cactorum]KAG3198758.1 hypothetical protein PC128_g5798 [Phytophthora cactorum]